MSSHQIKTILDGEDHDLLTRLHGLFGALLGKTAGTTAPASPDAPASTADASEPASPRRRARGSEPVKPAEAPATEPRRRLRSTAEAPAEAAKPAETPARRRRSAEPEAAPAEDKPIKDSDLSLAASEAATRVGPAEVKAIMEKFDNADGYVVETVTEIKPEDRRKFLDLLKKAA